MEKRKIRETDKRDWQENRQEDQDDDHHERWKGIFLLLLLLMSLVVDPLLIPVFLSVFLCLSHLNPPKKRGCNSFCFCYRTTPPPHVFPVIVILSVFLSLAGSLAVVIHGEDVLVVHLSRPSSSSDCNAAPSLLSVVVTSLQWRRYNEETGQEREEGKEERERERERERWKGKDITKNE